MPTQTATPPPFRSGAGRLCLDFVRTLRHRGRPDEEEEIGTPERLAWWLAAFGPFETVAPAQPDEVIADAHALREAIFGLVSAARSPTPPEPPVRRLVNAWASQPDPAPFLAPDGRLRHRAPDKTRATLALIARDALELIASPDVARLRTCANPDCGILFVDHSRPGTRRWCSMDGCGNRAKKAAQRRRSRGL